MNKETIKLLLEALGYVLTPHGGTRAHVWDSDEARFVVQAYKVLEEALAKQEQSDSVGEPVALVTGVYGGKFTYAPFKESLILPVGMALYSSPQQRTWVGLTDEEMHECAGDYPWTPTGLKCVRAIEAKLKEKNT